MADGEQSAPARDDVHANAVIASASVVPSNRGPMRDYRQITGRLAA